MMGPNNMTTTCRQLSLSSTLLLIIISSITWTANGFTIRSLKQAGRSLLLLPTHERRNHGIPIGQLTTTTRHHNRLPSNNERRNAIFPLLDSTVSPDTEEVSSTSFNDDDERNTDDEIEHNNNNNKNVINIVLTTGFESFNRNLYLTAGHDLLPPSLSQNIIQLHVFSDSDIQSSPTEFSKAVHNADMFIGSLIFDYDDVQFLSELLPHVKGPRLLFECATELMVFNRVGSFSMEGNKKDGGSGGGGSDGPPPAIKAILNKFSSGKEEDKINGYLKMLKFGPDLLKFIPGEKASDLRCWLESYRYWNQGGLNNVKAMLQLMVKRYLTDQQQQQQQKGGAVDGITQSELESLTLPELEITPDIGLLHPLLDGYASNPKSYMEWRLSPTTSNLAKQRNFKLAPNNNSPRIALLLYRKHVITNQRYIQDLITYFESEGLLPIPVFINGVEAHTIVRDWLTSQHEIEGVSHGTIVRDSTYKSNEATCVDAIVSTIGFPLVGGPAGSMEAGRNVDVAAALLESMDVPYLVASPLLLQSIPMWQSNGVLGLQSVVLYSLPELDGAIDTVVLGGLVGDKIALVPERVRKVCSRLRGWVNLRKTPPADRKISIMLYGFPPNVGAVGTAALLDVPNSLEKLLIRLHEEGYNVGDFATDPDASGQSLVAALAICSENSVIAAGSDKMQSAIEQRMERARNGDETVPETLARPGGGMGGATVLGKDMNFDELEQILGKYMAKKVRKSWPEKERGPGMNMKGEMVINGLQLGNIWITVQPLLGVEGDPMRLLFERDLTPHPQYTAAYEWMRLSEEKGGFGTDAVVHLGMHGTVEWLPGQPLGNDRQSWSDQLLGSTPNVYVYAANNPSESILAKRRGYGTLVSYNVPPYGRAGLYLELANLKDLVNEYRSGEDSRSDLRDAIWGSCERAGMTADLPYNFSVEDSEGKLDLSSVKVEEFDAWVADLSSYLVTLEERLFSSGLHTLGGQPTDEELLSYLNAYFDDKLTADELEEGIALSHEVHKSTEQSSNSFLSWLQSFADTFMGANSDIDGAETSDDEPLKDEALQILELLKRNTEEMDGVLTALNGGYVKPCPGGDLLRDGTSVLPTGRNIHALDPYRMPSEGAWARGQRAAEEILRQHQESNNGAFPETIAVTLWGLDTIKTRGEAIAIVLALVGARPVKEGTGRTVNFELIPLEELGRPRVDVLASLSGIFRDSFANVVDLLDDMFERASIAEESPDMNYIKKHCLDLEANGTERPAARLFSNPPGDYGSMVNEVVGNGDWDETESLGEIWRGRNTYSYGRSEGGGGVRSGTARPEVLDKLLSTTERVVQEIDSVEYGLTDIQEYYSNTGALKKAAENRKQVDPESGTKKKVAVSIIEAFGGSDEEVPVKDVEDVLRMEYRSKFLNPKWRDAMLEQGSGGAYEVSQRMTAMVGWAATAEVDNFVFDQAAERYALDEEVAKRLQKNNPEAFKNVVRRLLEANGRGMWSTDDETIEKLRQLYSDADDLVEQVASSFG